MSGARARSLTLVVFSSLAASAGVQLCNVPTVAHPTIGATIADDTCTFVSVAAGAYTENLEIDRTMEIVGTGGEALLEGHVRLVSGAHVVLDSLRIDGSGSGVSGCWNRLLEVEPGAEIETLNLEVVLDDDLSGPCWLFVDGFESAGTQSWSVTVS